MLLLHWKCRCSIGSATAAPEVLPSYQRWCFCNGAAAATPEVLLLHQKCQCQTISSQKESLLQQKLTEGLVEAPKVDGSAVESPEFDKRCCGHTGSANAIWEVLQPHQKCQRQTRSGRTVSPPHGKLILGPVEALEVDGRFLRLTKS